MTHFKAGQPIMACFKTGYDPLRSWFTCAMSRRGHEDKRQKGCTPGVSTKVFLFRQMQNNQWLLYCVTLRIRQLQLTCRVFTRRHLLFYCCLLLASACTAAFVNQPVTHATPCTSYSSELTLLFASTCTRCSCKLGQCYARFATWPALKRVDQFRNRLTHFKAGWLASKRVRLRIVS